VTDIEDCVHGLNPAWCAECNGKAAQQKADEEAERMRVLALGGWFPSKYAGVCFECKGFFEAGTPITGCELNGEPPRYKAACCAPAGDPA